MAHLVAKNRMDEMPQGVNVAAGSFEAGRLKQRSEASER